MGDLSHGRSYPVQEISGKFCENLTQECSIPLPKIHNADYLNFQNNPLYRRIYTVLRGGTYFGGRDFGLGAHKGVDIASKIGTEIYSIGTGEVIIAENRGDRGKVISIKHQLWNRFLYSNYAHLDEILVKKWELVSEGSLIAKMGNTGNSTGPHLHFQIDTNEGKHPYHPGNCGGETLTQIVNEARCRKQVQENTLDPILFLETQGSIFLSTQAKIPQTEQYFLNPREINAHLDFPIRMQGKNQTLFLDHKLNSHSGFLKESLHFKSKNGKVSFFPDSVNFLGVPRKILIKGEKSWLETLQIFHGASLIKEISVFLLDEGLLQLLREKSTNNPDLAHILEQIPN